MKHICFSVALIFLLMFTISCSKKQEQAEETTPIEKETLAERTAPEEQEVAEGKTEAEVEKETVGEEALGIRQALIVTGKATRSVDIGMMSAKPQWRLDVFVRNDSHKSIRFDIVYAGWGAPRKRAVVNSLKKTEDAPLPYWELGPGMIEDFTFESSGYYTSRIIEYAGGDLLYFFVLVGRGNGIIGGSIAPIPYLRDLPAYYDGSRGPIDDWKPPHKLSFTQLPCMPIDEHSMLKDKKTLGLERRGNIGVRP